MDRFSLKHTVLYSKGWYTKTPDDFWGDMKKVLAADDYSSEFFSNYDMMQVILRQFELLPRSVFHSLSKMLDGIHPVECWKHGYYTKEHTWVPDHEKLPEYEMYRAVISYCLSYFASLSIQEIKMDVPPNPNVLPVEHLERWYENRNHALSSTNKQ